MKSVDFLADKKTTYWSSFFNLDYFIEKRESSTSE